MINGQVQGNDPCYYQSINRDKCYPQKLKNAQTAINAMTVVNKSSWKREFQNFFTHVHALCLMPNDKKCVDSYLRANNFFCQPSLKQSYYISEIISYLDRYCTEGQEALVGIQKYGYGREFIAVVEESKGHYKAYGFENQWQYRVTEIWIRWADGEDHSPVKRRKGSSKRAERNCGTPTDTDVFHYCQQNPQESTGDCVVRAIASACEISWSEAVEGLIKDSDYQDATINNPTVFTQFLTKHHFVKYPAKKHRSRKLRGEEFCCEMERLFHNGERIFAYVGKNHVAAVLPFKDNGRMVYKIEDSWNSTNKGIGEYWVSRPNSLEEVQHEERITVGMELLHPVFGRGVVIDVCLLGCIRVYFKHHGLRILSVDWVKQNCK